MAGTQKGDGYVRNGAAPGQPLLTRRAFVLGGAALVVAAFAGWVAWGNAALETTHLTVESARVPAAFDGFRIVHVSDLHNAQFGSGNADLLGLLRETEPDLVAVTGDLVDSRRTDYDVAASFAEGAAALAPTLYVAGNHEARIMRRDPEGYESYEQRLAASGVLALRNEVHAVERAGSALAVLGADDPSVRSVSVVQSDTARTDADVMRDRLEGLVAQASSLTDDLGNGDAPFTLLLSHRPELFDVYVEAGIDLTLAGHAHGGQVRLPFVGGVLAPNQGFFPKYDAGLFVEGEGGETPAAMAVSRGLGNSAFPFRVNNRPELVLVELRRAAG